uniref:Glucagon / GIP / secretin / VIP family domain-containing protein n=1 Tax=Oncorhynchus mykiss TaxID=8022 RepID=A0A8C7QEB1_ONCMY
MARCHRATLVLLVCGILMHYRIYCSSIGLRYPKIRLLTSYWSLLATASGLHLFPRSPASLSSDNTCQSAQRDINPERAEEVVASTLREILGQLTARQYLTALMMIPVGEESRMEDESEPLSKRHSDGIFTDGYSRYRKHMAMKKYLEAVLGRRYRQRFRNKVWRLTYL